MTIMKTIYTMRSVATGILLLVMLTLTKNTWGQPVVSVPPSCNVVVPGAGGTPGFGGDVGSGGIVVMPDLNSAAGMFNINPMGNTILGWTLQGDLSVGPISQPTPAIQSVGAGILNAFITSYNKNVRYSETQPPSADFLARSKGRITISYTNPSATCGGGIYFDIFKEYVNNGWPTTGTQEGYVPEIIGPDCWEPSTTYTYSVDQIASDNYSDGIGGDEYYWDIFPLIGTFYTSADKSSITFTTPASVSGTYTIQCCFGRSNPWDGNVTTPTSTTGTCVTKTIGQVPGAPSFTTLPPTCVPVSAGSFFIGINPQPGYTYAWTSSNSSWFLAQSGAQNQDVTVSSLGTDPGILTLTITNGSCDPSIFTYTVNREFDNTMSITAASTCVPSGSTTNFAISTGAQNQTCWNLPGGWTYSPVTGSESSINVTVPVGTAAGAYTISAYSCSCPSVVLNVTVNVQPDIPVISGPSCVVPNGGPPVVYNASGSTGLSYSWIYPTGWNCIGGCVTASAVFIPGGPVPPPVNMTVVSIGMNGCDATSAPFVIDYSPVTPSGITANCWNFGVAGSTTITVANAPSPFYGSYTISSTPAGLITSSTVNPTTGVITVTTSGTAPAGPYTINVTHTTGTACGNSPVASFPITYNGNGTVLTTFYNPGPGGPDVYITSSAPAGSTYNWYLNGGGPSVGTGPVLYLTGSGPAPTSVCVFVSSGGCTTKLCASPPGTHNLTPGTSDPEESTGSSQRFELFPNPNDGNFSVKVPEFKNEVVLTIVDESGREIGTHKLKEGLNRISERDMPNGQYFLILNLDGEYSMHKLQILQK
jgi:hypothetical protein